MQSFFKAETLKVIGGGTIVLTALCIMLPGVMGYAFSLARLGLVILIAVVVSSALGFLWQYLVKQKKATGGATTEAADRSNMESTQD